VSRARVCAPLLPAGVGTQTSWPHWWGVRTRVGRGAAASHAPHSLTPPRPLFSPLSPFLAVSLDTQPGPAAQGRLSVSRLCHAVLARFRSLFAPRPLTRVCALAERETEEGRDGRRPAHAHHHPPRPHPQLLGPAGRVQAPGGPVRGHRARAGRDRCGRRLPPGSVGAGRRGPPGGPGRRGRPPDAHSPLPVRTVRGGPGHAVGAPHHGRPLHPVCGGGRPARPGPGRRGLGQGRRRGAAGPAVRGGRGRVQHPPVRSLLGRAWRPGGTGQRRPGHGHHHPLHQRQRRCSLPLPATLHLAPRL